jgi:hypothetical protein
MKSIFSPIDVEIVELVSIRAKLASETWRNNYRVSLAPSVMGNRRPS